MCIAFQNTGIKRNFYVVHPEFVSERRAVRQMKHYEQEQTLPRSTRPDPRVPFSTACMMSLDAQVQKQANKYQITIDNNPVEVHRSMTPAKWVGGPAMLREYTMPVLQPAMKQNDNTFSLRYKRPWSVVAMPDSGRNACPRSTCLKCNQTI